jgi:hypothetical protein
MQSMRKKTEARYGIVGTRPSIRLARPSITNTRGHIDGKPFSLQSKRQNRPSGHWVLLTTSTLNAMSRLSSNSARDAQPMSD